MTLQVFRVKDTSRAMCRPMGRERPTDVLSLAGVSQARCQLSRGSVASEMLSAPSRADAANEDKLGRALLSRIV